MRNEDKPFLRISVFPKSKTDPQLNPDLLLKKLQTVASKAVLEFIDVK